MHQSKGLWMLFGNCNLSNWRLGRHGTTKCEVSCWRCPIRIDSVRWWSQWLQVCDVWHGQWRRMCLGCYKCRVHSFFCRCKMLEPWANLAVRRRHDLCTSWRAIQPCHSVSIQTPSLTWPSESFIIFEPLNSPLKWKFDPGTGTSDLWMEWKIMQVSLVLVWKLRKPWKLHVVIVCAFMRLNIESIQSYKVIHWISNDVWWFNMIYVDHLDLLFGLLDPEMLHWGQVGHASTRRMLWLSLQLKRWCAADGWNMLKHVETCWNMLKLVCLERLESLHLCDDDSFVLWSQDLWCSFCLWQCLPGLVDTRRGPTCALDIKWIRYALERFSRFAHSEISSRPWGVWTCFSPWKTGERMWMVRCTTAILRRLEPWDLRRKGFASISSQKSLPGSLFLTTVVAANKKKGVMCKLCKGLADIQIIAMEVS